jgi:hypothetical protein
MLATRSSKHVCCQSDGMPNAACSHAQSCTAHQALHTMTVLCNGSAQSPTLTRLTSCKDSDSCLTLRCPTPCCCCCCCCCCCANVLQSVSKQLDALLDRSPMVGLARRKRHK